MDAKRVKNILTEAITTIAGRGAEALSENEELGHLLCELSDESTADQTVLTTEGGRRFVVIVSVIETPAV
jgi:hypothetical protein